MNWLKRKVYEYFFDKFRKEIAELPYNQLTLEQREGMFAQLWENKSFQNHIIKREAEIVLSMSNRFQKPSDEEYMISYGRRLELMALHDATKSAHTLLNMAKRDKEFAKRRKSSAIPQAPSLATGTGRTT